MSTYHQPSPTSLDDNILSYIRCIQLSCQSQSISKKQIYNFFTDDYDTTTTKKDVKQSLKRLVKRNCITKDGKKTYSYIQQQQISLESSCNDQKVDAQSSSDDADAVSTSQSQQRKKRKRSPTAIVELNDQGDKKLPPPLVNEKKKKEEEEEKTKRIKRSKSTKIVSPSKDNVEAQHPPPQSIDISPTISATAAPKSPSPHPTNSQSIAVSPALSISQQTQQKKTILRETDTILPLPTFQVKEQSSNVDKPAQPMPFKTPLSYIDLQFIKSQQITSDEELAAADISKLVTKYMSYTMTKGSDKISSIEATAVCMGWQLDAQLLLGRLKSQGVDSDLPQITQIPKESQTVMTVMDNVPNLCITDTSGDLPKRTIFSYDSTNNILYEFEAYVGLSQIESAGYGVFFTFKGVRTLKETTCVPQLQAGDSIDIKLDDFNDISPDNITFSNRQGLIELESCYAPLIPTDNKPDFLFNVKDFIFSNEPSSWSFYTKSGVADFTDDGTGYPHDVARSNISMYVNEVGHDQSLIENVEALNKTKDSVTYFINIQKPLAKGDTTELLVNYKEKYEKVRERRGYGKANLTDGVKSDEDDITRVKRNLKERFLTEESILSLNEDKIRQVAEFLHERVWSGVKEATSIFASRGCCKENHTVLIRQCVARRRLSWIARILKARVHELMEGTNLRSRSEKQHDLKDILRKLDAFSWDLSFVKSVSTAEVSLQKKTIQSLRWDLSEEMLFLLTKNKHYPLDEENWSPLSISLMIQCLHLMANSELFNIDKDVLRLKLFHMAYNAVIELNRSATASNDLSLIDTLAFDTVEVAVDSDKQCAAGSNPAEIIHQIVSVIYPIASLTDWQRSSEGDTNNNNSSLYSIGNLCEILC